MDTSIHAYIAYIESGRLTRDSKWGGGGDENTFYSVTPCNFQKKVGGGGAETFPGPPSPWTLFYLSFDVFS